MMMTKFLMMMMVENRLLLLWQLLLVLLLFLVVDVDVDFIAIAVVVVVVYFWISAYSVFSFSTVTVAPPSDMADLSRSAYTMSSLLSSVSPSFLSSPSFNSSDSAPPLPPDFLEATVFFIADSRLVTLAETDFLGSGLFSSVASGFPSTASVASADSVSLPSSFSTAFSLSSSSALCLGTAKQRSPWDRATTKTATTTMMTRMMMTTAMTGPVPASPSVFWSVSSVFMPESTGGFSPAASLKLILTSPCSFSTVSVLIFFSLNISVSTLRMVRTAVYCFVSSLYS